MWRNVMAIVMLVVPWLKRHISGLPQTASLWTQYCRYSVEELLDLSCRYGELRTLQRTLAAGGEGGRKALADICARLSQPPGHRSTGELVGAIDKLPIQDRLQFVQRCHLAMQRPELAGTA